MDHRSVISCQSICSHPLCSYPLCSQSIYSQSICSHSIRSRPSFFRSVSLLSVILLSFAFNACSLLSLNLDDDPVEREALKVREEPSPGSASRFVAGEEGFQGLNSALHISPEEIRRALEEGDVILGMATDQVIAAWGNPSEVESAGDVRFGNQKWTYDAHSGIHAHSKRVVYFENGLVAGWENPDARGP